MAAQMDAQTCMNMLRSFSKAVTDSDEHDEHLLSMGSEALRDCSELCSRVSQKLATLAVTPASQKGPFRSPAVRALQTWKLLTL